MAGKAYLVCWCNGARESEDYRMEHLGVCLSEEKVKKEVEDLVAGYAEKATRFEELVWRMHDEKETATNQEREEFMSLYYDKKFCTELGWNDESDFKFYITKENDYGYYYMELDLLD